MTVSTTPGTGVWITFTLVLGSSLPWTRTVWLTGATTNHTRPTPERPKMMYRSVLEPRWVRCKTTVSRKDHSLLRAEPRGDGLAGF